MVGAAAASPGSAQELDYSQRAQWLRAAVLGANDGLVSTASMMIGVSAVRTDVRSVVLAGMAGMVAGACSMGIGEFVSVYQQLDVELAQLRREGSGLVDERRNLPSPSQAALASATAFSVGALVPLLAAGFITTYGVRMGVTAAAVTLALAVFGVVGARLGAVQVGRSAARVLVGGWLAMAITYGLMKLVGRAAGF